MFLTSEQKETLRTFVNANLPGLDDEQTAAALNQSASPTFTIWKRPMSYRDFFEAINWQDVGGLTTANTGRLNAIAAGATLIDPAKADRRQVMADIFSSTTITKALVGTFGQVNTGTLWKRLATVGEKLFATGTGSDASPATAVIDGQFTYADIVR